MGKIKNVLAWTNPFAIPIFIGFILAAMVDGVVTKTTKIVKKL